MIWLLSARIERIFKLEILWKPARWIFLQHERYRDCFFFLFKIFFFNSTSFFIFFSNYIFLFYFVSVTSYHDWYRSWDWKMLPIDSSPVVSVCLFTSSGHGSACGPISSSIRWRDDRCIVSPRSSVIFIHLWATGLYTIIRNIKVPSEQNVIFLYVLHLRKKNNHNFKTSRLT